MKIVDAGYEILDPLNGEEILKKIERVARVCYKSEDKITEGSAEKMVRALIKSNHMAMLEHYSFSVKFICDRGVSHPYVLSLVAVSVWNTLNDPTTKGLGDSARAKSYTAPQ